MSTDQGRRLRDEAMFRVEANADKSWKELANLCGWTLALEREYLTSEDVLDRLARQFPNVTTHDRRAIGPVMQGLKRAGAIRPTERFIQSRFAQRHAGPVRVWASTLPVM